MHMKEAARENRRSQEGGAVLVIFALSMVMFFGFMALAVDASHAFVERRSSQSIADIAVVGGALQTIPNSATKEQKLVDEVLRLVEVNLGVSMSTATGSPWDVCNDADPLPITWTSSTLAGPSNCISWEPGFTTVRVNVPRRDIDTYFGGLIGINSISVGAAAEAEVDAEGKSGVLPFGVLGGADDSVLCLKTGSGNGVPQTCEDNGTGNFHYIDFKTFGNGGLKTSTACGQANKPERLKENIAHGVDHDLYVGLPAVPGANYFDALVCDGTQPVGPIPGGGGPPWPGPTGAGAEQGTISGVVLEGLVQGVTVNSRFFGGRLQVSSGGKPFKGVQIDNEGLWNHLTPSALTACTDLNLLGVDPWGTIVKAPDSEQDIISCIDFHAVSNQTQIFSTDALKGSVRFGWVPILYQGSWPSGNSSPVSFQSFQPMYIQTMFGGKCYSDGTCDVSIIPGETWIGASGKTPNALTAISIPFWAVEDELKDPKNQVPSVRGYALSR
jgi:Flp pilus assembly protein TadG